MEVRIITQVERRGLTEEAASLFCHLLYEEALPGEVLEKGILDALLLYRESGLAVDEGTLRCLLDEAFDSFPPSGLRLAEQSPGGTAFWNA
jgi:hypothetical protein